MPVTLRTSPLPLSSFHAAPHPAQRAHALPPRPSRQRDPLSPLSPSKLEALGSAGSAADCPAHSRDDPSAARITPSSAAGPPASLACLFFRAPLLSDTYTSLFCPHPTSTASSVRQGLRVFPAEGPAWNPKASSPYLASGPPLPHLAELPAICALRPVQPRGPWFCSGMAVFLSFSSLLKCHLLPEVLPDHLALSVIMNAQEDL